MNITFVSRIAHAWNAFMSRSPTAYAGSSYSFRPDRVVLRNGNERSIITSIFNRISIDAAQTIIRHCHMDNNGRYKEEIDSPLNSCLALSANIDQTGRSFLQDTVMSLLDEGCVAIVPVDFDEEPDKYDIYSVRTGKVLEWHPKHVRIRLYNDRTGEKEEVVLPKQMVGIVENPLYSIVNERNSTVQRLSRKLSLLDATDEKTASGKLDLIISLPYSLKSPTRKAEAEERRKTITDQLTGSQYGIAYVDSTEKVIQLNRSLENNLLKQIEYLTEMVYSQLGLTQSILDGTADEKTMLNYMSRTIEPIIAAIVDEMNRKFLTEKARADGEIIMYFRDPFKFVPVNNIAEIADKFTRNEIMTSNEMRQVIGMKPSDDPKADELRNSNISQSKGADVPIIPKSNEEGGQKNQNGKT